MGFHSSPELRTLIILRCCFRKKSSTSLFARFLARELRQSSSPSTASNLSVFLLSEPRKEKKKRRGCYRHSRHRPLSPLLIRGLKTAGHLEARSAEPAFSPVHRSPDLTFANLVYLAIVYTELTAGLHSRRLQREQKLIDQITRNRNHQHQP